MISLAFAMCISYKVFMQTKDLLDCSQDVLRAEKALEVQYEEYYEQLASLRRSKPPCAAT